MVFFNPDFIFRVQHPSLNEDQPGNSVELILVEPTKHTKTRVTLSRAYDFLKVAIHGLENCTSRHGDYLFLIPLNGGKHVVLYIGDIPGRDRVNVSFLIHTELVKSGDHYGFYLIQANMSELPWHLRAPASSKPPTLPAYEDSTATAAKETMSALLRDVSSVDTKFVFGSSRVTGETCLWAHRVILAKSHEFDVLLEQISHANGSHGNAHLTVTVTKVSLPVMATLLKYLYVREIRRINYPEDFAISKTSSKGCHKDHHEWHCLDLEMPLSDRPVTWQELLDAATIYGLDALRAHCRAALIAESRNGKKAKETE
ncbi:hypothetical protein CPC16_006631 [Podila verticillata]|nr:hypothetical protein CPC16_006631 [Podila verticillata]KAI9241248.1 MAG: hypothetical protein BYD32DRAFT_77055 [Podila humilis]KFH72883.1 hypothetical protein MVEG_00108 [Podila verticillata NRRL 6337]